MFRTNPISLKALLEDANSGKIQLPDFQRGWVWEDDRIRSLLASVSRGFPVGAIMTLEAGGEIQLKARMIEGARDAPEIAPEEFLLDGQQRLTALFQSLLYQGPVDTHENRGRRIRCWYYVDMLKAMDPKVDREEAIISVSEDRKKADLSRPALEYERHMIPTEKLLDSAAWLFDYVKFWNAREHPRGDPTEFVTGFLKSVTDTFTRYDLPVIRLDKETPKEAVCTIFEKVNTGGVPLSVFELVTAIFAAQDEAFSLRVDWEARCSRLRDKHSVLQGSGGSQFLQAVALLTTQQRRREAIAKDQPPDRAPAVNCSKNDILGLEVTDYQKWAERVEEGFVEAAKFLHNQFVLTKKNVPYTAQLVPLATLFVELGPDLKGADAIELLERWYWSGIFGETYSGAVETQYIRDLMQVPEWIRRGGPEPTVVSEARFLPERLLSLRTRQSAADKGLYALQMKSGACDWKSAKSLLITPWHDENVDIHHIFPKRWCDQKGRPRSLYNSIINKTPIDASTNREIGGNAPSAYLGQLQSKINADHLDQVLKSHWIEPNLLRNDQFDRCFVQRGKRMLELIGQAMGREIQGGQEVFQNALTEG